MKSSSRLYAKAVRNYKRELYMPFIKKAMRLIILTAIGIALLIVEKQILDMF